MPKPNSTQSPCRSIPASVTREANPPSPPHHFAQGLFSSARIWLSVLALAALAVPNRAAAQPVSFSDPLTGPSSPNLTLPIAKYGYTASGLQRTQSDGGTDRVMVTTASGGYLQQNQFTASLTVNLVSPDIAYFGLGQGTADPNFFNEPSQAFLFRIHNNWTGYSGIQVAATTLAGGHFLQDLEIGTYTPGPMTFLISRNGDNLTLSVPSRNISYTYSLSQYSALMGLNNSNTFLFFGNSTVGTVFSNETVNGPPVPFSDPLTGPSSPNLTLPFAKYGYTSSGLQRTQSDGGTDRVMVTTASGGYLQQTQFTASLTVNLASPDIAYFGLGQGTADPNFFNEPSQAFLFRIHNNWTGYSGIQVAATTLAGGHFLQDLEIGTYTPGPMTFLISRNGDNLTLSVPSRNISYTYSLSQYSALMGLNNSNTFLFFGNSTVGTVFSNATVTLTIAKGVATVTLGSLAQTYNGSPRPATATTSPAGLTVNLTYNGSATAPTAVGSYTVVGTVNDVNYAGAATNTLTIAKGVAAVTLGSLAQTYNGSPRPATATTTPAGLTVNLTYNGLATAPTAIGSYTVVGTVNDVNYTGTATNTLTIAKGVATVTLGNLAQTYNGSPRPVTATTTPAGLTVNLTYNGSATAPTAIGSYTVVGTVNDVNYTGAATNTLTIKALATVTLGGLTQPYDGSAKSATATTVPAGLTVDFTYNGTTTAPANVGSYTVVGTVNEANYAGSATNTLIIANPAPGVVAAWGLNFLGQQFTGPSGYAVDSGFAVPSGLTGVKAVAACLTHTMALKTDGTVVEWGNVFYMPVPAGLSNVIAIAAGDWHNVALKSDGTVVVWGTSNYGLTNVPAGLNKSVMAIASGVDHILALKTNGTVVAWGNNSSLQTNVPPGLTGVKAIAAGPGQSMALKTNGTMVVWGWNGFATVPSGLSGVQAMAAGDGHDVVLKTNGTVVAWGNNAFGQTNVPAGLNNVTAIAAGGNYTLALKADQTVVAWGRWSTTIGAPTPGLVNVPAGLTNVTTLAAGQYYGVAVVNVSPPTLGGITPAAIVTGSTAPLTLNLQGSGFTPNSFVRWDDGLTNTILATTYINSTSLSAQVPTDFLQLPSLWVDLKTAQVSVLNPIGGVSAAKSFTIKSTYLGSAQSSVAAPGQPALAQTLPTASGQAGLSASFINNSGSPATVTTAVYTSSPFASTSIDTGGGMVDLQISGANPSDSASVQFYYSSAVTGAAEAALVLKYFNGAAWTNLLSSGGAAPVKNTTDNLEGTVSGGRFSVLFDNTSTPKITELTGTVIALSINQAPVAQADVATARENEVLVVNAPGVLGNDTDPDGDALHAVLVSGTSHGQVTLRADGSFSYTPQAHYSGPDSFRYKASDGNADSAAVTVAITVMPLPMGNAVVVARNSASIAQNAVIRSGDMIVNEVATGDGAELSISQKVATPAGFALRANRISLDQKAVINSDLYYNTLLGEGKSTIQGARHTPLVLPVFDSLPPFETGPAGSQDISAKQGETVTLNAASYRDVVLKQKSTLLFTGGTYNLRNLDIGQDITVLFAGPSTIRIAGKFALDQKSTVGPKTGSSVRAADIVFYVNGSITTTGDNGNNSGNGNDGNQGNLGYTSAIAAIGQNCTVQANIYAPNGTLSIDQNTHATGAFLARNVVVGQNVELSLASHFGAGVGPALASLTSRAGGVQVAVPLVTQVQRTAEGAVDLLFTGNPGSGYSLQASQDLKTWENLADVQAGPDGAVRFTDAAASTLTHRFYRLVPMLPANKSESGGAFSR